MIRFGDNFSIVFRHHGRARGKHATSTTCFIYKGETKENRKLVSSATTKPVKYIPLIMKTELEATTFINSNQKHIKLVAKDTDNVNYIIILKGDTFSYEEGRRASLKKALESLDKGLRAEAWDAYHAPKFWKNHDEEITSKEEEFVR